MVNMNKILNWLFPIRLGRLDDYVWYYVGWYFVFPDLAKRNTDYAGYWPEDEQRTGDEVI